jgi:hypothetical protein
MMSPKHAQGDAEVLYAVARRLFAESAEKFRRAHANRLGSENALSIDEHLELFGEAIEREKEAVATQAEAIENQRQAGRIWQGACDRLTRASES